MSNLPLTSMSSISEKNKNLPHVYIIGSPIGNLEDITLRALRTLRELSVFFVEDSRESKKLFSAHGISLQGKTFYSYANHNLGASTVRALEILNEGTSLGVLSDRGTPGLSDPGQRLARSAHEAGYPVVPVAGVSSITCLLSVCGYETDSFLFLGFFPREKKNQKPWLDYASSFLGVTCFFESCHRINSTMRLLQGHFPTRRVFIGHEMTKRHEKWWDTTFVDLPLDCLIDKGEYVIALGPPVPAEAGVSLESKGMSLEKEVSLRLASDKEWSKEIASKYLLSARDVYQALLAAKATQRHH